MKRQILCAERLSSLRLKLVELDGVATLRDLQRSHGFKRWEIVESAALGWVTLTRLPQIAGRPSFSVAICVSGGTKTPLFRCEIEKPISARHREFGMLSVLECVPNGAPSLGMPGIVRAYQAVYRKARSANGAAVNASRLLRKPGVRAVRAWCYAIVNHEISADEEMPELASEIWQRLHEAKARNQGCG